MRLILHAQQAKIATDNDHNYAFKTYYTKIFYQNISLLSQFVSNSLAFPRNNESAIQKREQRIFILQICPK